MKDSLFVLWGKRNPEYEIQFDEPLIKQFSDYGKGSNSGSADRAKILGAGYEVYIMAFFIGLYADKKIPLTDDHSKRKDLGHPLMYWGNQENRKNRKSYNEIIGYIFAALVAKTDIDFIGLEKGKISARSIIDQLINTMEEYANYGFSFMLEKIDENPNYFFNNEAFLKIFISFLPKDHEEGKTWHSDDEPDNLEGDSAKDISNKDSEATSKTEEEADEL